MVARCGLGRCGAEMRGAGREQHPVGSGRVVHAGQQRAAERLISTVYREDRTFHRSAVGGRWRRRQVADELGG